MTDRTGMFVDIDVDRIGACLNRAIVGGIGMGLLGLLAIANPFWLVEVTYYPGTDWTFLPLVHAAFTTIGVIGILSGSRWIIYGTPKPDIYTSVVLAVLAIIAVPLYWHLALVLTGVEVPMLSEYGSRRSLVAGLLAAGYIFGVAVGDRNQRQLLLAISTPILPAMLVAEEWTRGALLEPILEAHFFFTGAPILEIPRIGTWLFVGVVLLGFVVTRIDREGETCPPGST